MRLKSIDHLTRGDRLAKPIYDNKCQLLLTRETLLTEGYIERLKKANVQCAYIEDALSEGIELNEIISDELKIRSVSTVKNVFSALANDKTHVYTVKSYEIIQSLIDEMLSAIYDNPATLYHMTELMGTDMYTYYHSAEVAILSMLVARSMGLNDTFVKKIGIGAMLHDIGKMKIDQTILNKIEPLTTEEIDALKDHPRLGYDMLKDSLEISPISRQIVLLHHEKLNGSGYPMGLSNAEIPIAVRVVTMCDIFNAVTSNRSYKRRMNADHALELLRAETVYELDREVFHHLLKVVNIYPAGTLVKLSDGRTAIVIKENPYTQTRPTVHIVENNVKTEKVDLMDYLTLFIEETIE